MRNTKKREPRQVGVERSGRKQKMVEPLKPHTQSGNATQSRLFTMNSDNKYTGDTDKLLHELEVRQLKMEMQNEELRRTQKDLEESHKRYHDLYDLAPVGYFTFDKNGVIIDVNHTGCLLLGIEKFNLIKKPFRLYISPENQSRFNLHRQRTFRSNDPQICELTLVRKDGKTVDVLLKSARAVDTDTRGNFVFCRSAITDITEQKQNKEEQEIMIHLLGLLNATNQIHKLLQLVTGFLKKWSGCEAVGIRLKDSDDFPYFETSGFPEEFIKAENKLCSVNESGEIVCDSNGRPYLECMCGNIISGRFDPAKPFFTEHGSFWTNSTTNLISDKSSLDKLGKIRNHCNSAGYESVALVPLRTGKETFGLLQFNSKRREIFTPGKISFFERLADNLAIGMAQRKADESLRESENKFKTLSDEISDALVIHDGQSIIEVNKAFGKIWGYEPNKVAGAKIEDFLSKDSLDIVRNKIQTGYDKPYEIIAVRSDGTSFTAEITGKPIIYKGKTTRIATVRDITEHKKILEAILREKKLSENLINSSIDGIHAFDIQCRYIIWNPVMERMSGIKKDDVLGRRAFDIFPFLKEIGVDKYYYEALAGKSIVSKEKPYTVYETGKKGFYEGRYAPLFDEHNNIIGGLAIIHDITERKKAKQAMRESEEKFRAIAALSPAAIAILRSSNGEERFLYVNTAWELLTGYSREDAIQLKPNDLTHPDMREQVSKRAASRIRGETVPSRYVDKIITKSGETRWLDFAATMIQYQEAPAILTISLDITEQKVTEKKLLDYQKQLKRLASQLITIEQKERRRIATNVHDEIGQALAIVKINLDKLRHSALPVPPSTVIDEISGLVEQIIQKTRTLTFDLSNPTLYELGFEAAVADWLMENVGKKYGIDTFINDDGKPKPLSDDLKAILFRNTRELLTNCIKHSKAVKVEVKIRKIDDFIQISVEDNGVGFEPAQIMTIGKKATFGLFSIHENLETLGGRLEIDSKPGAGCKAVMTAPIENRYNKDA